MDIIVAHYLPAARDRCREQVTQALKTLNTAAQEVDGKLHLCDDGSPDGQPPSDLVDREIELATDCTAMILTAERARTWAARRLEMKPEELDHLETYYYAPKTRPISRKARLWNLAVSRSREPVLAFFDDDNLLLDPSMLRHFRELLERYEVVFGQIIDRSGHRRSFNSHRVQGTTFAIRRPTLEAIGGFGEWTEEVSSAIDSDLWWKLYQHLGSRRPHAAAFTTRVRSRDLCHKRWLPFAGRWFRHRRTRRAFARQYPCPDYTKVRYNPSRDKSRWMDNL